MQVRDLRNIRDVDVRLGPGLNVFVGRNAQGKTSLLEAAGLLARGRSFRTEHTDELVRRGAAAGRVGGEVRSDGRRTALEVEIGGARRRLRVDGRDTTPRDYLGRLEVVVYSTDRLRVIRGPMRERRLYVDRSAAALWPSYRQAARDFERVLEQRNAALEADRPDLDVWDDRFVDIGAALRLRRSEYVRRLREALRQGFRPGGESYDVRVGDGLDDPTQEGQQRELRKELEQRRPSERRARRSLAGPHRDPISILVDGRDAAPDASSGQGRSALLALTLAALDVYQAERGTSALALLDDLDSELDEERTAALCRDVASRGQAMVSTAHPGWARRLGDSASVFGVAAGEVLPETPIDPSFPLSEPSRRRDS